MKIITRITCAIRRALTNCPECDRNLGQDGACPFCDRYQSFDASALPGTAEVFNLQNRLAPGNSHGTANC